MKIRRFDEMLERQVPYIKDLEEMPYSLFDIIVIGENETTGEIENLFQY